MIILNEVNEILEDRYGLIVKDHDGKINSLIMDEDYSYGWVKNQAIFTMDKKHIDAIVSDIKLELSDKSVGNYYTQYENLNFSTLTIVKIGAVSLDKA